MRHEGNCRADTSTTSDTFCIASHCLIHSLPWSPILPVFTQLTSQWADLDHIEIEANHDCAQEQTKGNKLEPFKINQVASPLGNFLTTPLSIYPLVSLSLHGVAASPQIIEATEPCERQSEIGRWEMHEITKRMKILSGVYVSASERRRCWDVRRGCYFLHVCRWAWREIQSISQAAGWSGAKTAQPLLFTHSQLNTSLCSEAWGPENRCIYQG